MASILCLGDLHIQPSNLEMIDSYFSKLKSHLDENKYETIIILGDTLHTHEIMNVHCVNKMIEYVSILLKYCSPIYIIIGNHEYINNKQNQTNNHSLRLFSYIPGVKLIDKITSLIICGRKIIFSPFIPDGCFKSSLDKNTPDWKSHDLIFCHQSIDGAQMGAIKLEGIETWSDQFPIVISGHIHCNQKIGNNWYYSGSSIQVTHGECEDKLLLKVSLDNLDISYINIYPPKKENIKFDLSSLDEKLLKKLCDAEDLSKNKYIKLIFVGTKEEINLFKKRGFYNNLQKNMFKISFKHKESPKTKYDSIVEYNFNKILLDIIGNDRELKELLISLSQ